MSSTGVVHLVTPEGSTGPQPLAQASAMAGHTFPLVYQPSSSNVTFDQMTKWIQENRDHLLAQCMQHGAILFRGFEAVKTAECFATVVESVNLQNMPYVGGAAVRTNVVRDVVFTANESPPSEPIPFHHEMAQVPEPPTHLFFYCETAPETGGETPIILSNSVYEYFRERHPQFCAKMEDLGVKYIRTMPEKDDPTSAIGRSWKSTFLVETREEAEAKMKEVGTEWEWLDNGNLKTTTAAIPAIRVDARSGKKMFFNSVVAAFTGWVDSRNDPTKSVVLGDGTPVDAAALNDVANFMSRTCVKFPWKKNDVLMIDNTVAMHSRATFEGPRRVLAAIGRGVKVDPKTVNALTLNRTGDQFPQVGYGCWKVARDECVNAVYGALKAGYRHIDSACDYGNEIEVGQGIKRAIDEKVVERKDVWVTSKLWNTFHRKEHVKAACLKTLKDLGLEYLDLYLIHFPISLKYVPFETRYPPEWFYDPNAKDAKMEFDRVPLHETWAAMEELVKEGLVRNIGICNYNSALLMDLLNYCTIKPAVLQIEVHPYLTQDKIVRMAQMNDIQVTAFSPLGAASYVELGMGSVRESVMTEPIVKTIATRHGVSPAQVVLRWGVQRGYAVIPKTSKQSRLGENMNVFNFKLTDDEMSTISALNRNRRFNDPGHFCQVAFNTFSPIYD